MCIHAYVHIHIDVCFSVIASVCISRHMHIHITCTCRMSNSDGKRVVRTLGYEPYAVPVHLSMHLVSAVLVSSSPPPMQHLVSRVDPSTASLIAVSPWQWLPVRASHFFLSLVRQRPDTAPVQRVSQCVYVSVCVHVHVCVCLHVCMHVQHACLVFIWYSCISFCVVGAHVNTCIHVHELVTVVVDEFICKRSSLFFNFKGILYKLEEKRKNSQATVRIRTTNPQVGSHNTNHSCHTTHSIPVSMNTVLLYAF